MDININITKTTETINTPTLDEKWRDFEAKTPILTKEHKKYIKILDEYENSLKRKDKLFKRLEETIFLQAKLEQKLNSFFQI